MPHSLKYHSEKWKLCRDLFLLEVAQGIMRESFPDLIARMNGNCMQTAPKLKAAPVYTSLQAFPHEVLHTLDLKLDNGSMATVHTH